MANANYEVTSWQGLLQQVVLYVGRGYFFAQVIQLPEKKREKWPEIDRKLLKKFQADQSRFQRARKKMKGLANFVYLRWENQAILLATKGVPPLDFAATGEHFQDIRCKALTLVVGKEVRFRVTYTTKVDVYISPETYKGIKAVIFDAASLGCKVRMQQELRKLRGLPSYAGVNAQKKELANFAKRQLGKRGIEVSFKEFQLPLKKKMVKVFSDDKSEA